MHELDSITKQTEITALTIHERIARIHDALRALRDMTLMLYDTTSRDDAIVQHWLDTKGFDFDEYGYFERTEQLKCARAGEIDPNVQIYYVNEDISSNPEALFRMYALRSLPRALKTLAENLPELAWNYYQDATGMVIVYPMHDPCTVVPADFDWHAYYTYKLVSPENNPERLILWTPPNIDYGGKGLMVAPSIPLYRNDEFFGVWSFDVPVSSLIKDCMLETVVAGQQSFIVDRDGVLIAHDSLETLVAPSVGDIYRMPMKELGGGFGDIDLDRLWESGQVRLTDAQGELRYVIGRPVKSLDWLLVASIPAQGLLQKMEQSFLVAFDQARLGDFEHRLDSIAGSEMRHLVEGFNEMAAAVQSTLKGKEQAIRELEESRDRARAILEASPVGLGLIRMSGEVVVFNPELAVILGIPPTSHDDLNMMQLVPPELVNELQQLIDRAVTRGQGGPVELELLYIDGQLVPVKVLARRLEQREGMLVLLGIENITDTRRLQSQLLHAQKMDAIGKLASSVAHDFNNILTVIMSYAGSLKLKYGENESAIDFIDHIELAAERATSLTGQLLTFSRQELIHPQQLDLGKIIRESEQLLRQLIEENIKLDVVIEENTPLVKCDAAQLLQIIMNLVINARDALHDRGGRIELKFAPCQKSRNVTAACITVCDNGSGIDPDIRAKIFDPFFTTKRYGTGLGLSTVHDVVVNMGGSINVESCPSRGTSFTVVLPASLKTGQIESITQAPVGQPVDGCVVVVDDDPMVREATIHILEHAGIEVRAAADARQALTILEELGERAAILVTDVIMPGMGGRELAAKALELNPNLPVLYITGYTDDAILHQGLETDAIDLLRKPYSPQIFINVIKRIFARTTGRQFAN